MKKFKIALWLILIILLVLVFFQNKEFLLGKEVLKLNLVVIEEMQGSLPIAVWLLVALCVGFLFAYFLALLEKFKTGRMIKALKAQNSTQTEMITQLKKELESRVGFQTDDVVNPPPIIETGGSTSSDI
jgi:hypothetical protein